MKILATTQVMLDQPAGGTRHVLAVTRELAALGHDVTLVAPGQELDPSPHVRRIRPPDFLSPGLRMESAIAALASRHAIVKHPQVAYCRISATSSLVPLALHRLGTPVVVELNGRILDEMRERGRSSRAIKAVQLSLSAVVERSRGVIVTDEVVVEHAREALGASRVFVVPNGADLDVASPGDRDEACRALGLDTERPWITFLGTLAPEQRIDLLLEAHHEMPGVGLLFAGDGLLRPKIEDAARSTPADRPIVTLGNIPHARAVLAARAGNVCVNVREGFMGMKCVEYAAIGRRIVTFKLPGTERIQSLYGPTLEALFLVEERSAEALRVALLGALDAERRLGPFPADALANARRHIGWNETAQRLVEVFKACVSSS